MNRGIRWNEALYVSAHEYLNSELPVKIYIHKKPIRLMPEPVRSPAIKCRKNGSRQDAKHGRLTKPMQNAAFGLNPLARR